MTTLSSPRGWLLAGLTVALAACASSGGSAPAQDAAPSADQVSIEVDNDLIPPTEVTVWITPATGSRRRLGTISPSRRQTFTYTPGIRGMQHTLEADARGENRTSNPFTLEGVKTVRWSVSTSNVSVVR